MHVQVVSHPPTFHRLFNGPQPNPRRSTIRSQTRACINRHLEYQLHGPASTAMLTYSAVGRLYGVMESIQYFPCDGKLSCEISSYGACEISGSLQLYNPALHGQLMQVLLEAEAVGRSVSSHQGVQRLTINFETEIVEISAVAMSE